MIGPEKNSTAIAQLLQRYEKFGVNLGLDRIRDLLNRLGHPEQQFPIIHVAGTNGKGSVCAYLSSVLTAAGYRVGRYISPHLVDYTERICLNDQAISPEVLLAALHRVEAVLDPALAPPTQFEILTATAWSVFAEATVDIAVIEVGLGGRLDATNVCDQPLATVITSLSLDHWQKLGPTLADIAWEKAGILKTGCPAIIGELPLEAETVVRHRAEELNCPTFWIKPAQWLPAKTDPCPWAVTDGLSYPLPLLGDMQLMNSALAIATLKILREQGWKLTDVAVQAGMAQTQWPGRLQWTQWQGMKLLIDGAHNPGAAIVLRQYVDQYFAQQQSAPVHWLMGMLATKDHADVFRALLRDGDRLTLVPVPGHFTADPQQLLELAQSICPNLSSCNTAPDLQGGFNQFQPKKDAQLSLPVLCGSLYLVGFFLRLQKSSKNLGRA